MNPKKKTLITKKAYNNLYGKKKDDGMLWGKKIKGPVRTIDSIIEEENRIVIEGTFVKSLDKDGNLQTFVEHEMRNGVILLTFNVSDDTNGIFIKMRFDNRDGKEPRKECNAFKDLFKAGNASTYSG